MVVDMLTSIAIVVISLVFLGFWAMWEKEQDRKYNDRFRRDWQELRELYAKKDFAPQCRGCGLPTAGGHVCMRDREDPW